MLTPTFTQSLLKPMTIGGIVINTPLTLAPMAGQTNHAFRVLCRSFGGVGLVCTEVLSSVPLLTPGSLRHSERLFDWTPEEFPIAVQLYGAEPYIVAEGARIMVDYGARIIDINMGCWVPKIVKKGGGAALLRDVCTATAVVEAVVKAVNVPVTVKVRAGFDDGVVAAIPFARAAEQVGAQAIAVHARFAKQGFSGHADWDVIRQVKEAVSSIPVIGNGDVTNAADARKMFEQTGCDGVMIGRAALGNPWIFSQIEYELTTGHPAPQPTSRQRAEACLRQAVLTLETSKLQERQVLLELRGQLAKYADGIPDSGDLRTQIVRAESLSDIERALAQVLYE